LLLDSPLIRPLRDAVQGDGRFLQVLLTEFRLRRKADGGTLLSVSIADDTPAIREAGAKHHLRAHMTQAARDACQKDIDDWFASGRGEYVLPPDSGMAFRYASGGTLPIVVVDGREHFCFFYRDLHPIGWNIANGGTDDREELANPLITVDRELREEMIILDESGYRHVFSGQGIPIVPAWLDGPDSLEVQLEGRGTTRIDGCFVTVTAEDFGIEIDRVARFALPSAVVFCDGETEGDHAIDSPVGLFNVERLWAQMRHGPPFVPDVFFFGGRRFETGLDDVLDGPFVERLRRVRSAEELERFRGAGERYALCPVTARLVERYGRARVDATPDPSGAR
jgi:hypothetical protein